MLNEHMAHFDLPVIIWFLANLLTGLSYLHIPYECWHWIKRRKIAGLEIIVAMFMAFIVSCGLHHLVMLRGWAVHHVDALQLVTDSVMAIVSVTVAFALRNMRHKIRQVIALISELARSDLSVPEVRRFISDHHEG
jgi:cobalamin biosynthesis protein CobD/CbiB